MANWMEEKTDRIEARDDALSESDSIDAVLTDEIHVELWRKFMFICAQAGMTATTRLPVGTLRDIDASWAMYRRIMEGVQTVAAAEGIEVPEETVTEWLNFASDLELDMHSSLYYDLTHDKRMELDAFHGSIVRHANDVNVDVPMSEAVYAILRPWADRNA